MLDFLHGKRVVVVAAHPDDEVIGAGVLLRTLIRVGGVEAVHIIHTTDGSPLDLADARRSGFNTRKEYADARRIELACALKLAGIPEANTSCLNFTDQQTMHCLPELCDALSSAFARLQPDVILTQPYEGGHPDHDSTAFAVDRACRDHDHIYEMTSYFSESGSLATGRFLPEGDPGWEQRLTPEERELKARMLACFKSQEPILRNFPVLPERVRRAPRYDFTKPPHAGKLHYETLPWGITGDTWRQLAAGCLLIRK